MVILVKILGLILIAIGVIFAANEKAFRKYLAVWRDKKNARLASVLAFVCAVIFLRAAYECRVTWFMTLFGILSIIKGAALLIIRQKNMDAYLNWWDKKPVALIRATGVFIVIVGMLIIYSA